MNNANAGGFFLFGLLLALPPLVAPGWFPPSGIDGTSGRALWLEFMGGVQVAVGAVWLGQSALGRLADRLATFEMRLTDSRAERPAAAGDWATQRS